MLRLVTSEQPRLHLVAEMRPDLEREHIIDVYEAPSSIAGYKLTYGPRVVKYDQDFTQRTWDNEQLLLAEVWSNLPQELHKILNVTDRLKAATSKSSRSRILNEELGYVVNDYVKSGVDSVMDVMTQEARGQETGVIGLSPEEVGERAQGEIYHRHFWFLDATPEQVVSLVGAYATVLTKSPHLSQPLELIGEKKYAFTLRAAEVEQDIQDAND